MTKKTQSSSGSGGAPSPKEIAEAFMQQWQEKWAQMLRDKGWPADMAMPGMTPSPLFHPMMAGFAFPGMGASQTTTEQLQHKIAELEKRIALLESHVKPVSAVKKPVKKPAAKAKNPS